MLVIDRPEEAAMDCHHCQLQVPILPTGLGRVGSPLGTCATCSSSSCGFHGVRTLAGRFMCLLCEADLATKLSGHAAWDGLRRRPAPNVPDPSELGVAVVLIAGPDNPLKADCCLVNGPGALGGSMARNLEEWLTARPDLGASFVQTLREAVGREVSKTPRPRAGDAVEDALTKLWAHADMETRELMALAVLLARRLRRTPGEVNPMVVAAARLLGEPLDSDNRHETYLHPPDASPGESTPPVIVW